MTKKQYSPEMRMQIVKETLETGNASIVARRHEVARKPGRPLGKML